MKDTLIAKAISFATNAHSGQQDKGGQDYILHPLRVMFTVRDQMWDEKTQAVAVLHDVIEDCDINYDELVANFGEEIADAVKAISRRFEPNKEVYTAYIKRIKKNPIARVVKIGDLFDNLQPERIALLPVSEQGIVKRYKKALRFLSASEADEAAFEF